MIHTSKVIWRCKYGKKSWYAWASLCRSSMSIEATSCSAPSIVCRAICTCRDLAGRDSAIYARMLRNWIESVVSTSGIVDSRWSRSLRELHVGPNKSFRSSGTAFLPIYKSIVCPFSAISFALKRIDTYEICTGIIQGLSVCTDKRRQDDLTGIVQETFLQINFQTQKRLIPFPS